VDNGTVRTPISPNLTHGGSLASSFIGPVIPTVGKYLVFAQKKDAFNKHLVVFLWRSRPDSKS
jgi:hypothetical protein